MIVLRVAAFTGFIASIAIVCLAQTGQISGPAYVVDGDTLRIEGARIRLFGIDAPEAEQRCDDAQGHPYKCGMLATSVLEEEIGGNPVICSPKDVDCYGRTVAVCSVNGIDLGDRMVRRGVAVEYDAYSDGRYTLAQREAQRAKLGLWAGTFVSPWIWRAEHR